jgi:hypothetical protein
MLNVSIAINRLFDTDVHNKIESSLGRKNLFDVVKYYYSNIEDINYSIFFFRGKKQVSWEYITILTKAFKVKGVAVALDDTEANIDFYNDGQSIYKINTTHPKNLNLEGSFNVQKWGNENLLKEFNKDLNMDMLNPIIHGGGSYFFFSRDYIANLLTSLNIFKLYPMLFWDYDSISDIYKRFGNLKYLIDNHEFHNLETIRIKPAY